MQLDQIDADVLQNALEQLCDYPALRAKQLL